jgi:hypothetical protein
VSKPKKDRGTVPEVGTILFRASRHKMGAWIQVLVVGETALNLLIGDLNTPLPASERDLNRAERVSKSSFQDGQTASAYMRSQEDIDHAKWVSQNARRIGQKVENLRDHDLLKKIASLIEYKE